MRALVPALALALALCGTAHGATLHPGDHSDDAVFLLAFNFTGGDIPGCMAACDANGDGAVTGQVTDAVYILNFNFTGGIAPPAPFPECANSTLETDIALGCDVPCTP